MFDYVATTKLVIILVVIFALTYDCIIMWRGGVKSTISRVTLAWAQAYPIIPLAVGILIGHLFVSQGCPR
jgi:hypothetical protein